MTARAAGELLVMAGDGVAPTSAGRTVSVHEAHVLGQGRADELELQHGRIQSAEDVTPKVQHPLNPDAIRRHILNTRNTQKISISFTNIDFSTPEECLS